MAASPPAANVPRSARFRRGCEPDDRTKTASRSADKREIATTSNTDAAATFREDMKAPPQTMTAARTEPSQEPRFDRLRIASKTAAVSSSRNARLDHAFNASG